MNPNDQAEKPAMPPSLESLVIPLADPVNQEIGQNQVNYDAGIVEIENIDRSEERYGKLAEASKADADSGSLEIQEQHRSGNPDSAKVYKIRAKRNGHLEDVEIYQGLKSSCAAARASSELKVSMAAGNMLSLKSKFMAEASRVFTDYLTEHITDFRPLMLFLGMVAEYAKSGDCEYYNARHDLSTPLEFALSELGAIVRVAFKDGIPEEFGSKAFLQELPSGLRQKTLSPLQSMAREKVIAGMEASL